MTQQVRALQRASTMLLVVASLLTVSYPKTASAASGKAPTRAEMPAPIQDMMTLTCQWGTTTFMEAGQDNIKTEIDKGTGSLIFSAVGGQLMVIGKAGGEKLTFLANVSVVGAMFFVEVTPAGIPILWSFYRLKDRRVLFIKQNNYAPKFTAVDGVHIYSHAGYCNVTGGNGRAITR